MPISLAVTSTIGRILLYAALLCVSGIAVAMLTMQNARYGITAYRAGQVARASFVIGLLALGAALLI